MKRIVRGVLAAAIVASAAGFFAPSASAHTEVCVGQGTATTSALYYPVLGHSTDGTFTFNVGTGACVSGGGVGGALNAAGTLQGWCGQSNGRGTVNTHSMSYESAGTLLVIFSTPTAPNPPAGQSLVLGVASAVPNVTTTPAQSCLTGATNFLVTGAVAMVL